jgi:DNA primase
MHEPEAQRYLDRRGINSHSRDRFLLGYAPQAAMKLMHDLGTTAERRKALSKLGLVGTARGEDTAKFFQRVMFPIRDRRGRSIAFGGRVLDSGEPKYLNSPESPLFHKGRQLYGLFEARQAHNKLARLLVVEGYMDVIMLAQHGLTESVATLGTATSRDHAETLFRTVSDVYFCFDGDRAGRSAAWRALTQVLPRLTEGRQAFFLFLPEGEDPDSLVQSEGKQGFEERLRGALPLSSYLFQELRSQSDLGTLEGRAKLVSQVRPLLSSAPDSAFRDLLLLELEKLSGTKVHLTANNESVPPSPSTRYRAAPARTLIRLLLSYVLAQPDIALKAPGLERLEGLERPGVGLLIKLCELVKARPGLNTASMLAALESAQLADTESLEALSKLAMSDPPGEPEAWEQDFLQGLQKLLAEVAKQRIDELRAQMEHEPLSAKQAEELRRLLLESKPRR